MDSEVLKEKIDTQPLLNDPRYISIFSLLVLVLTLLFWWWFSRRRQARSSVLLAGLTESGKTLLFVRLVYSQYRQTFTSMQENIGEYLTPKGSLKLVDLPGHERLRYKFFDQYKSSAKAIVYVVDSVTIQKEIRDVAEYLYNILADPVVQRVCPPVLILCNKQDQPLAKGSQVIKGLLEKEINLVRVTKASQLQSVDPHQEAAVFLGRAGRDFEFSQLPGRVELAEGAANTADHTADNTGDEDAELDDVKPLQDWLARL